MPYDDASAHGYSREEYARDQEEEKLDYMASHLEKWAEKDEQVHDKVAWLREYYSWITKMNEESFGEIFDMDVYPYSFPIKIGKLVGGIPDIESYTRSSIDVIYAEVRGLVDIVNRYIDRTKRLAAEPCVTVKLSKEFAEKYGSEYYITKSSMAKLLVEMGAAKYTDGRKDIER